MTQLRITKYNPRNRDDAGKYLPDDWTSVSDVGKYFEGKRLTITEYLQAEGGYVEALKRLIAIVGVEHLTVNELEINNINKGLFKSLQWKGEISPKMLKNKMAIQGQAIYDVVRMVLREMIWCKLSGGYGFYVHFGHDYYMYVGFDGDLPKNVTFPSSIYVEPFESPYA